MGFEGQQVWRMEVYQDKTKRNTYIAAAKVDNVKVQHVPTNRRVRQSSLNLVRDV